MTTPPRSSPIIGRVARAGRPSARRHASRGLPGRSLIVWVGGLIGARIAADEKLCGRIAFALSLLELVAFLAGVGK